MRVANNTINTSITMNLVALQFRLIQSCGTEQGLIGHLSRCQPGILNFTKLTQKVKPANPNEPE